jgi:hypothetical protein
MTLPSNSGTFEGDLRELINRHSLENSSDTPDYILAQYIAGCVTTFNNVVRQRDAWHGFTPWPKRP